jgi:poly(A) polymerase
VAPPVDTAPPDLDPSSFDPDAVKTVLRLQQHGHQAYFVGGCVRDLLVGRKPKDFDVATSAHPGEVRATFRNCRLIGRRFRLAHVYFKGGKIIEVSTFRDNPAELEERPPPEADANPPEDGEEPRDPQPNGEGEDEAEPEADLLITQDNVFGTAEQDARRRDFTINGLFYDFASGRVIDYVRGRRDLDERYIRTIGDPERRMREDPVRILRAVRFASKLEFDIESRTYAAMEGAVEDLPRCAPPRLLEETFRLIRGGVATPSLKLLAALDALKILLPPIADYFAKRGPEGEKAFYAFTEILDRRVLGGAALEDSVLLAAMLLPIALAAPYQEPEGGEQPTVAAAVEDLLADLVRNARLPRRIAERCRLILIAQRTLSGQRRRRGSLMSFRRHPLFNEALTVFEIWVDATGEHREALEKWKSGDAPLPQADAEGPPKKRRRRRRRRGPRLGGESPPPAKAE